MAHHRAGFVNQLAKAHVIRARGFAGPAGKAAVHMQRKAFIHRNAPARHATHQSDTSPGRIGFRLCNPIGGTMRQT